MTRKHFEALAAVLKEDKVHEETVARIATVLAQTNKHFDRERFYRAVGI